MRTPLCDDLGIQYPIFGFTPSPEVAVAISKAGGLGVLGTIRYTQSEELEEALTNPPQPNTDSEEKEESIAI